MTMSSFKSIGFILLICIGLLMAGCAGMGRRAEPPKVNIADIKVSEFRSLETDFNVVLRLINPNDFPLKVRGLQFDMNVQGKEFATGVSNQSVDVPALGSAIIQVDAYASVLKMAASVWGLINGPGGQGGLAKALKYNLSGKLLVASTSFSKRSIPFESKGELSFNQ